MDGSEGDAVDATVPGEGDRRPSPVALARAYYRSLDAGDYGALAELLAPGFRQVRGDRTLDGREAFVRFMREERPETDTTHVVERVLDAADAASRDEAADDREVAARDETADDADADGPPAADVVVEGRLHRADGSLWVRFVDVFACADGRLVELRTYTQ